jgi:DNA-binding response OmpR family regulator
MCQSREITSADASPPRKLLVVQNEATLRLGFSYALSDPNTRVETAADGIEALGLLEKSAFDLVILDLRMPGMDGISVIEKLRSSDNRTPIILSTTLHRSYAAMRAITLGVVDFLIKPCHPDDVRKIVESVLQPPLSQLTRALNEVRNGRHDAAIRILENIPSPGIRDRAWLRVLTLIRNSPSATAPGPAGG